MLQAEMGYPSPLVATPYTDSQRPVRVIAVTSGKGGVGKTTVSINLAVALASLDREVFLLDADLGLANVDVMLGLKPEKNLSHVIDGVCPLQEILLPGPAGIHVIPGASGIQRMADLDGREYAGLVHAFNDLTLPLDVLIIDTPAGISESVIRFCSAAQEVIVVVCNEPASITDAYAMIKILHQEYRVNRFRVLVNMTHYPQEGRSLFNKLSEVAHRFLDVSLDLIGAIPYDAHVRSMALRQRALMEASPGSPAARAFRQIAPRVNDWPLPEKASGKLEFFWERLLQSTHWRREVRI
jgi:flagellar biosynthesis protein FlhG